MQVRQCACKTKDTSSKLGQEGLVTVLHCFLCTIHINFI